MPPPGADGGRCDVRAAVRSCSEAAAGNTAGFVLKSMREGQEMPRLLLFGQCALLLLFCPHPELLCSLRAVLVSTRPAAAALLPGSGEQKAHGTMTACVAPPWYLCCLHRILHCLQPAACSSQGQHSQRDACARAETSVPVHRCCRVCVSSYQSITKMSD